MQSSSVLISPQSTFDPLHRLSGIVALYDFGKPEFYEIEDNRVSSIKDVYADNACIHAVTANRPWVKRSSIWFDDTYEQILHTVTDPLASVPDANASFTAIVAYKPHTFPGAGLKHACICWSNITSTTHFIELGINENGYVQCWTRGSSFNLILSLGTVACTLNEWNVIGVTVNGDDLWLLEPNGTVKPVGGALATQGTLTVDRFTLGGRPNGADVNVSQDTADGEMRMVFVANEYYTEAQLETAYNLVLDDAFHAWRKADVRPPDYITPSYWIDEKGESDYAALQKAINYGPDSKLRKVFIPGGTYEIAQELVTPYNAGLTIEGSGFGYPTINESTQSSNTILKWVGTDTGSPASGMLWFKAEGGSLSNICFWNPWSYPGGPTVGVVNKGLRMAINNPAGLGTGKNQFDKLSFLQGPIGASVDNQWIALAIEASLGNGDMTEFGTINVKYCYTPVQIEGNQNVGFKFRIINAEGYRINRIFNVLNGGAFVCDWLNMVGGRIVLNLGEADTTALNFAINGARVDPNVGGAAGQPDKGHYQLLKTDAGEHSNSTVRFSNFSMSANTGTHPYANQNTLPMVDCIGPINLTLERLHALLQSQSLKMTRTSSTIRGHVTLVGNRLRGDMDNRHISELLHADVIASPPHLTALSNITHNGKACPDYTNDVYAVTATADPGTQLYYGSHHVISSSNAAFCCILPLPLTAVTNHVCSFHVGANGFELRASGTSVYINGVECSSTGELFIPANTYCMARQLDATNWRVMGWDVNGTPVSPLTPDGR